MIEVCGNNPFSLTADSNQEITWNTGSTEPSILITESGEYFVETTSVCTGDLITSDIVTVNMLTPAAPIVTDVITSPGSNVTLTAEGDNLFWYSENEGGFPIAIGETFITPIINIETVYYVENVIIGSNNVQCASERIPVMIGLTGTEEIIQDLGIEIYPNPASDQIIIDIESASDLQQVELINSIGQTVAKITKENLGQQQLMFDVNYLRSGSYTVKLQTTKGIASKIIMVGR